jgi:uncharacterized protein HemX
VTAAGLVAAALLVGTAVAWVFALDAQHNAEWANREKEAAEEEKFRAEQKAQEARLAQQQADQERQKAEDSKFKMDRLLCASYVGFAQREW